MGPTNIKFVGTPCGQHGPYTFYKAVKFKKELKTNLLSLGEFFFIKIFKDVEVCIGELQLLWEDRYNPGSLLAMVRLYFLPEQTPDGRKNAHGEDEVLMEQDKVPFLLDDLVTLLADEIEWTAGSRALCTSPDGGSSDARAPTTTPLLRSKALDVLKTFDGNNKGLDMREINLERKMLGEEDGYGSQVVILNYTQYCRFRSMSKRLEGCKDEFLKSVLVGAMGGYITLAPHTRVLFCRDMFEHPVIQEHEMRQDHLAPNLRGRPKKKRLSFRKYEKDHVYSNESDSNDSLSSERSSARSTPQKFKDIHHNTSPLPLKEVKSEVRNAVKPIPIKADGQPMIIRNKHNTLSKKQKLREERLEDAVDISIFKSVCKEEMGKDEERFLRKLGLFMKRHSMRLSRLPTLGFKPVDLFQFFCAAQKLGGYQQVTEKRKWKQIYDELGGSVGNTSAATCTRRHYEKLLLEFEKDQRGEKSPGQQNNVTMNPRKIKTEDSENGRPLNNQTGDTSATTLLKKKIKDLVHKEPLKEVKQEENEGCVKKEESELCEEIKPPVTSLITSTVSTTSTLNTLTATPTTSANQESCNNNNRENRVQTPPQQQHSVQNSSSSHHHLGASPVVMSNMKASPMAVLPSSGGFLQKRHPTNPMSQGLRQCVPNSKENMVPPQPPPPTVLRQPLVNVKHNLIGVPGFRLPQNSIAAVLPQPPAAHNHVRPLLPPAPDADTSMLKNLIRKLPPAHVHRKVSLLTEPIHGAQAHKLLYAATQITKPTRPFLNPAPLVRNPICMSCVWTSLDIFPNSKINEVNKLQISRQPGEAASKYMNLATPPPAHCNPVKSGTGSRLNASAKKRPLSGLRQNSVVVNNVVRPGLTEPKRPRLVSDFLANAPPKNPFLNNTVIQSGPNVAHKNHNSNNRVRQPPQPQPLQPQQVGMSQTRTVIQPVPSAHSNYHTSGGAMTVTSASSSMCGSPLDFSKKSLNIGGLVGGGSRRSIIAGGLGPVGGGLESPIIISPPLAKEEPVNLSVRRAVSLSTSQLHGLPQPPTTLFSALSPVIAAQPGTLIPMVAMPSNMVTMGSSLGRPVVSVAGNVISGGGERLGPAGEPVKLQQSRVVTPKAGDPPPLSPHVHPAFLNGTVQPQLVMPTQLAGSGGTANVKVSLAMGQYILPLQQMQQLYSQPTQVTVSMSSKALLPDK